MTIDSTIDSQVVCHCKCPLPFHKHRVPSVIGASGHREIADTNGIGSDCKHTSGTAFSTNAIVKTKDVKVSNPSVLYPFPARLSRSDLCVHELMRSVRGPYWGIQVRRSFRKH